MTYIEIGGLRTWYDEAGSGEPLVLLHGGLPTNETWAPQISELAEHFQVLTPERRGHGHTPDVDGLWSYEDMAADTIAFLEAMADGPAHLVGWSDGGIIALLVAARRADLVRRLVVISANFDTSGVPEEVMSHFSALPPHSESLTPLRSGYQATSPDGPEHWRVVFAKFVELVSREPHIATVQLGQIVCRTLVLVGDDDLMTLEHTIELFRAIPDAELAIVPGTSHFLTMEKPTLVNRLILEFLQGAPPPTMMPIRRATYELAAENPGTTRTRSASNLACNAFRLAPCPQGERNGDRAVVRVAVVPAYFRGSGVGSP
jgi:pimeloyl-ACP methyl ester carboxylesterase